MVKLERRDRGIMCFVIILFAAQFMALSYVTTNAMTWSQTAEVAYNVTDVGGVYTDVARKSNSTDDYAENQETTYDNTTKEQIIAAQEWDEVDGDVTNCWILWKMNSTFLATSSGLSKVTLTYNYVGSGNVTGAVVAEFLPTPREHVTWGDRLIAGGDLANNGTLTWNLEAFQSTQLKVITYLYVYLTFADVTYLPTDGDYASMTVKFYAGTLLLTNTQILQGLAGCIGIVWFVVGAAISPFWNPKRSSPKAKGAR